MTTQQIQPVKGIVKQILSGDSVVIRGINDRKKEKTIVFSNITAPKLARRPGAGDQAETKDEPWAWEAREFLRKKLIEKEVFFTINNSTNPSREYGTLFFGPNLKSAENITRSLISEGLVTVRKEGVKQNEELQELIALENAAKQAGKGKWGKDNPNDHVRDVKWSIEGDQMTSLIKKYGYKPVKAIIEHVRDGSTVRAILIPDFYYVTVMITGIRCNKLVEEAKEFVEFRLLQKEVDVTLESVSNNNFIGTISHPVRGSIAEYLLRDGLAHCVDWSMGFLKNGAEKLRAAEQFAKEKRLGIWKDWQANQPKITGKERDYHATVTEVINGDAIMVKLANGEQKKVFLSSIRPPREASKGTDEKSTPKSKSFRPLYDIPYMFEAREYLRRELIGKKVHVLVDYIQEAKDNYPEKVCATVTVGGKNVAEGLVAKGLATVVRYKADDDQRSSKHHELLDAEAKAIKSQVGMHSKKKASPLRVTELDAGRADLEIKNLQRAPQTAIVEFVSSGSRLRLYIPKSNILCTYLLGGINCPRAARPANGAQPAIEGEPFGEEALNYTRDHCLQREVSFQVVSSSKTGKAASLIGWLWVNNENLSVTLVKLGYASVHRTGEKSQFALQLKEAADHAKSLKLGIWKNYVEKQEDEIKAEDQKVIEVTDVTLKEVIVTEVTPEGNFFVQTMSEGPKAEALNAKFRQEFEANPPLPGSFTPKRGEICAAKFSLDNEWYRAKVEKIQDGKAQVLYIDYGNRELLPLTRLASLPSVYSSDKPFATEYCLPFVSLPKDEEYAGEAIKYLKDDTNVPKLYLKIVYRNVSGPAAATLQREDDPQTDIIRNLLSEGYLVIDHTKYRRNNPVLENYKKAQEEAKKNHLNIWEYGDITHDDAKEFGMGK